MKHIYIWMLVLLSFTRLEAEQSAYYRLDQRDGTSLALWLQSSEASWAATTLWCAITNHRNKPVYVSAGHGIPPIYLDIKDKSGKRVTRPERVNKRLASHESFEKERLYLEPGGYSTKDWVGRLYPNETLITRISIMDDLVLSDPAGVTVMATWNNGAYGNHQLEAKTLRVALQFPDRPERIPAQQRNTPEFLAGELISREYMIADHLAPWPIPGLVRPPWILEREKLPIIKLVYNPTANAQQNGTPNGAQASTPAVATTSINPQTDGETQSNEASSERRLWGVWGVVAAAALGLLWLVLKNRRKLS